ncbi:MULTISPECIES: septum site-determining protein MinC [Zoogloea]|jgi:septum site-determining protein MinC|uniref:Probable septum site-determining protein MinC n=1 Tax=Zoogloea oleivorans TaxID=1552750 RepID=A0A6C2D973_9RHOO|nr:MULTISPECIES: septum site-determining protein MinC [Zoogloea]MBP8133166.1 septum site-determining protein MinC [Zoogloea sp.]MBT9497294.1 septum site-determining protein MinC [Zoogloea sp.]MDD2669914.1 septum site-determining protein MinC [Zoogloea sp.]TYC62079.1 septum site-determining protein MinC [Zoogloea oleivorans]
MADAPLQGKLIEFKGASLAVMTAHVRDTEAVRLADALHMMLGGMPDFFAGEPTVLDFAQLANIPERVDWTAILSLLRRYQVQPIGVRNLPETLHDGARRAGLALLGAEGLSAEQRVIAPPPAPAPVVETPPAAAPAPASSEAVNIVAPTLIVDRPLRSGQQVYAKGGDLVLLAGMSPGSEVIADGSIHCYGHLRGRALAGARGDTSARIFSTNFGPELVSIAGVYRTFERGIPQAVAGRGAQVKLTGSDNLHTLEITPLQND